MKDVPVPAPDLEIRVTVTSPERAPVLSYLLHSASGKAGFTFLEVQGPRLSVPLIDFSRQFFDQIEKLHEGFDVDGGELLLGDAGMELVSLGQWLYRALFNTEMRRLYRLFRKGARTLQITSEEAAIPWEMVKPYDDSDLSEIVDDDFFCMQFQLTRWLSGPASPRSAFGVRRLACIGGGGTEAGLPQFSRERALLASLARRHAGLVDASPSGATFAEAKDLFEKGGIDLFHFIGHGDFLPDAPAESKIVLEDRPFRSRNLSGSIQTRMRQDRPLILFNACRVARQGWSLAGLDGWARAWVEVCECGAFVGPAWLVKDSSAYELARTFYGELEKGRTLGEAALAARQAVRKLDPGRPNWLAYVVYGHPNASLAFGSSSFSDDLPERESFIPVETEDVAPERSRDGERRAAVATNAPPAPEIFVGRSADLDSLKERMGVGGKRSAELEVQVLTAVRGWPGVGKTSLAAALSHDPDISMRFEGVLWASLGQEPDLLGEMAGWGRWLGSDDLYRAGSLKEAVSSLKALLRERRMVLVLDDVWEIAHAAPFQNVRGRECPLLVTTRETGIAQALAGGRDAVHLLDVLDEKSALDLLAKLAPEVVESHADECRRLVNALERLPLALQVAGRQLQAESAMGWGVEDLLRNLESGTAILRAEAPPDRADPALPVLPTVSILLQRSTDRLDAETRERFRLLGGFVAKPATFGIDVLRLVWELEDPRHAVRELVRRGLLEPAGDGRFQIHSLLLRHAETLPPAP